MPKHLPKSIPPVPQQPTVVKYVQPSRIGIQSHTLTRHCIGYVRRGTKYIYYGDVRHAVGAGEVFYLSAGTHYTEDVPTGSRNFEQVVFYYTSEQLARILNNLSLTYQLAITNDHSCPECEKQSHVVAPGWPALKNFFSTINAGLRDNLFADDDTAVHLKLTELVYLIPVAGRVRIKSKILSNMDLTRRTSNRSCTTASSRIFRSRNWRPNATGVSPRSRRSSASTSSSRRTNGSSANG